MNIKKIISIGCLANVAEWYDFSIYAFLAATIGELFFDSKIPQIALIKAFFLFTVSYLIRPIGSVIWGYVGDTFGRRIALRWSLFAMALPTILIGLLPTYSAGGYISIILLIIFRLIQGFAAGGELPITACYVYEAAPKDKKNVLCSIVIASSFLGVLCGSAMAYTLYALFNSQEIISYAWRFPFLFGIVVFLTIMYVRRGLEETLPNAKKQNKTLKIFFSRTSLRNLKVLFQVMILCVFLQSSFYLLFVWMPSYLNVFLNFDKRRSFFSNTISMIFLIAFTLIIGYFAEKIKHKKLVVASVFSIAILSYPLFLLLQTKIFIVILLVQFIFAFCLGCIEGVIANILTRSFDTEARCSGAAIAFTIPTAIFGGILPTLCSYLIYKTGISLIPVFFLIGICLLVLPVAIRSKIM